MSQLEFKDKTGNIVNLLTASFYDQVDSISIDISTNYGYDTSHSNQDGIYLTIDNATNGSINTFRPYNLPINEIFTGNKSSGTILVKKQVANITDTLTGFSSDQEATLQSITNNSINTNIISYPFTSTDPVIAKIYVTIASQKYSAVCPSFVYNPTLPTLSNFNIKQNADSSKLEVTNLNVQNITSIKYYPARVIILADVLQKNGDLNNDYEFELGRTVVNNNNQYIANSSSMTPLNNNNNPISDNNVIPLTQNKYEISTSSDASAGILYKQTNKDLIVYSISETKSNVILDYSSQSTNTLYLRAPVSISNVTPFDAIINAGSSDSSSMSIMNVFIDSDWSGGYEPTSFVFKLTTINNNISPNAVWTFSTSTVTPILYRADGIYNITLNQMVYVGSSDASDTATHPLDNNPSSYQLTVTARWVAINESRSTTRIQPVVFTQDFPTVLNVTAYNAWQTLSTFNPENIVSDDTVMPRSAFILKVLKNNLFNGNAPASLDDPTKTQFQIQYIRSSNLDSNGNGNWIDVPSGYMTQPSDNLTGNSLLYNGALSALTGYNNSPNSQAGGLFYVPALEGYNIDKVGSQQNPLFVYIANIGGIYNESAGNPLLFRVKILSSVDGYDAPSSQFVAINTPIYTINKPLRYSFTTDSILEPSMDFSNTPNTLVIPMLVGGNDLNSSQSIYYSKGYVQWVRNSAITLPNISAAYGANPRFNVNLGTLVTYNVVYEYINPNISGGYLSSKQSIDYSVKCQGLPAVSSDFTVSNDSTYYVYDNAPDADSLRFSLSMVNDSTSDTPNTNRIDGVDLYIKDINNNVLNNGIRIARFYNYNASGIVKYAPGSQTVSLSSLNLTRGNSYKLEFKAFRDSRVESKGGLSYSSTIVDHYNPPPFIYLNTNVRDTPISHSWGLDDISAQPYINFITDNVTTGNLVIPMDITQSPNYYGAYVNWYKNDYLGVDVANDDNPAPEVSALQSNTANLPQFVVTYGTVVIYTVTYVYLSLDGTTQILGAESTRRSLSAQGMPAIGDFTQSPAENPNAIYPAPVVQYIQDNTFNSLVFKLHTVDTLLPSTHRIDGVILFVTNDTGNQQYVATFSNADINLANGDFVVTNFTGSAYSLTPGNTYTLTFSAYRDRRVLNTDASYPSDNFKQSVNVISTVDFVFLANSIAPVFDDQTSGTNIISVEDPISHSSSGPADQYTINWPHSKINDVTQYLIYRVTPAIGSVPESSALENIVPAHFFPFSGIYSYQYDIPATSQKVIYDIQKSYNGRLSASTRISFPTGKLIPAHITIVKQDFNNIMVELEEAFIDITIESVLLDIMVISLNGNAFPFTFNGGKKNTNGTQNVLTIPESNELKVLGKEILLQQKYQVEWSIEVNGTVSQTTLDTSYGDPATFVYASKPSISLYYPGINDNMTEYQGKPALKLSLNANMGAFDNVPGFISPALTSLVVVLSQDTSTVVQNVKVDGVENLLMFNHADDLQPNSVYNAVSDFSNSSMKLLLNAYSNNVNTTFQLYTGNLTLNDASYLVFPDDGFGYVSNTGVDFMMIASNNYGIDSYVNSFVFVNKPTFTQNGVTVTDSFTIQNSEFRVGEYFSPNYPISNSSGVISYSSSNSLVATVDASGLIGALSAGSTTITMTQAAATSGNYASRSVSAILVVLPPLIEPSLSNFTVAAKNMGDAAFSLTAPTSNSNGSFSYTSSNTDVATIASGINWTSRNVDASGWWSVAYGNGLWVAVASSGNERVMTSPDGINWTSRKAAANSWVSVAYGNGLWVAVASDGILNSVMTSIDGINWTGRNAAAANSWVSVAYGNGLWVAVAQSGTGNSVMTSPDGINWTSRNAADDDFVWSSVAYGNGLWVAVSRNGDQKRVMTSPDGIHWTLQNSPFNPAYDTQWYSVAYGNGLWVAVASIGTGNRVMTSPDGINWTGRNAAADSGWISVAYGNGLWVAVSYNGLVMTSPNGITWTLITIDVYWRSVAYGNGLWVAVSGNSYGKVITSSANSINIIGAGSSIITATQAATNIYSSKTISATFTVNPPDYSVTNFALVGEFNLADNNKYQIIVTLRNSSVGAPYGHKVAYYPTSNPANTTVLFEYNADGTQPSFYVYPLEPATDYTVSVTLVNKNTDEELTNLQYVQTITFTTPNPIDYSVTNFSQIGEIMLTQNGTFSTAFRFTHSSAGTPYGHNISFHPIGEPGNVTVENLYYAADGISDNHHVYGFNPSTDYIIIVKLVNKNTGEELTNLHPVQLFTFTTPTLDYSISQFARSDGDLTLISPGIYRGVYRFVTASLNSVYVNQITYNLVSDPSTVYVVGSYAANGMLYLVNLEPLVIGEDYALRVKTVLNGTGVEVPNFEQIINFQV